MRIPVVDMVKCVDCDTCMDLCPAVFKRVGNGHIEVVVLSSYPEKDVDRVIQYCLGNCVSWKEE